jgi:hypothetical protein
LSLFNEVPAIGSQGEKKAEGQRLNAKVVFGVGFRFVSSFSL